MSNITSHDKGPGERKARLDGVLHTAHRRLTLTAVKPRRTHVRRYNCCAEHKARERMAASAGGSRCACTLVSVLRISFMGWLMSIFTTVFDSCVSETSGRYLEGSVSSCSIHTPSCFPTARQLHARLMQGSKDMFVRPGALS